MHVGAPEPEPPKNHQMITGLSPDNSVLAPSQANENLMVRYIDNSCFTTVNNPQDEDKE